MIQLRQAQPEQRFGIAQLLGIQPNPVDDRCASHNQRFVSELFLRLDF
jgi:hypothetical protein